jgi:hypothetical protein
LLVEWYLLFADLRWNCPGYLVDFRFY